MNTCLIAHTQLSENFKKYLIGKLMYNLNDLYKVTDGQLIALTSIRNCYSYLKPTDIISKEFKKYFLSEAKDGKKGSDADRLFRQIFHSKHLSTLEHLSFTFAIDDLSRTSLAQLTRHRIGFSFSVESQRFVKMGRDNKSKGATFYIPEEIRNNEEALKIYLNSVDGSQAAYDELRKLGISPENARQVFPNATITNIVMTCNLRSLLDFYSKRKPGRGAQSEIAQLAQRLRSEVVNVEPWTDQFFEGV